MIYKFLSVALYFKLLITGYAADKGKFASVPRLLDEGLDHVHGPETRKSRSPAFAPARTNGPPVGSSTTSGAASSCNR